MAQTADLKLTFQQNEFDKAFDLVSKWDFSLTKRKLEEPDSAGWTKDRIDRAEKNYKRYLAVTKALNGYQLVPNGDVDRFWHEHILDTRRYAQDCTELFGGFLHHYPYFGMRGETDNQAWLDASGESTNFWEYLFDESLYQIDTAQAQKCPQKCPGGIDASIDKSLYEADTAQAQKCPQKCPGGIDASIDESYPYLLSAVAMGR